MPSSSSSVSLLLRVLLLCALGGCPSNASGIKDVPNNAAALQIQGPKGWLPADVSDLKLTFSPPLEQGVDFSIWAEPSKHVMPAQFQIRHTPTLLHVLLKPGKRWVKKMSAHNSTQDLRLVRVRHGHTDITGYKRGPKEGQQDTVARITPESPRTCPPPRSLQLPGASPELQRHVDHVLLHCHDPLIIPSRDLKWKHHRSLSLLLLQPAILFVNGSDQSSATGAGSESDSDGGDKAMLRAAKSVDRFLAAHSVLDVVWEPMTPAEPQVWILMPRPLGMPGHLFAAMDALQWRHPLVTHTHGHAASAQDMRVPLHSTKGGPGGAGEGAAGGGAPCQHTKLAGITGSGYSADAFNIYNTLRDGFMRNLPVQAFPSTLSKRSTKPCE